MSRRLRIAFVFSHPIQHYTPICRELARENDLEVRAFFCCDWGIKSFTDPGFGRTFTWDVPLLEGYDHEFLPISERPKKLGFWEVDNPKVIERLEAFAPDAVWIHGYGHLTQIRVWRWAGKNGVRRLYFGDSELLHERGWATGFVKPLILSYFFRPIEAFITIGDNNEAYYRHYGVPREKMFRGACPVDIARFVSAAGGMGQVEWAQRRVGLGLDPDAVVALFVGKFIGIKRPQDLVEAVAALRAQSLPTRLQALFIGSGEMEASLRSRVQELGAESEIRFSGFINQEAMPSMLALGDVVVMPSEVDPHPLVVTEGMSVGNAIIASDRVGCVGRTDAARPGVNTIVFPCGDQGALADALRQLAGDRGLLARYRQASREIAWSQDVAVTVKAIRAALNPIIGKTFRDAQ